MHGVQQADCSASMKYFTGQDQEQKQRQRARPQQIDNMDIEGEHPGQLKPNLLNFRDFVLIPEKAWILFMEWYGGGPAFPRRVIATNGSNSIEMYPPLVTSVLCGQSGNPVEESSRSLFVYLGMKLSEVHLKICECYNQLYTKDSRLWLKQQGTVWAKIELH
jgi:DUSP domain